MSTLKNITNLDGHKCLNLGQVFTPQNIVECMLWLVKNKGGLLEPSCGLGAFLQNLPKHKRARHKRARHKRAEHKVSIEIDSDVLESSNIATKNVGKILNMDFFAYNVNEKFDTIIGNPPYVRYQDILPSTKFYLQPFSHIFDKRSNLYLFFIYKNILHLRRGGELIFITPRDFLKGTSSIRLNNFLFSQGMIADFIDLGDKKIFSNANPNCAIWRFEKGNFDRHTALGFSESKAFCEKYLQHVF